LANLATSTFFSDAPVELAPGSYPSFKSVQLVELPTEDYYFVDVNPNFGEDARGELLTEDQVIKAQIRQILSTPLGTEHFEPTYGSLLPFRIMEPMNAVSAWNIENDTINAVGTWLASRITLQRQDCLVLPLEEQEGYYIQLRYLIKRLSAVATYRASMYRR